MRLGSDIDRLTIQRLIDNNPSLIKNKGDKININYNHVSNICVKENVIMSLIYKNVFFSIGDKAHYIVSGTKYHFIITHLQVVSNADEFELCVGGNTLNKKDEVIGHAYRQCYIAGLYKSEVTYKEYSII
jgi:hypothetical protein